MASNAHFTSFEIVERLRSQLLGLAKATCQGLDEAECAVRNLMDELAQKQDAMGRQMSALEQEHDEVSETDDEDDEVDYDRLREIEYEMEAVRERQREINYWQGQLSSGAREFFGQASVMRGLAEETAPKGAQYIDQTVERLRAYLGVTLESAPGISAKTQALAESSGSRPTDLATVPLPSGYHWVKISEINLKEIPDNLEFKKASHGVIENACRTLQVKILPALQEDSSRGRDYFIALDRAAGQPYPDGELTRAYEMFFGGDPVYVQGHPGQPKTISSGRHRIMMAQQLGWSSVPVWKGRA